MTNKNINKWMQKMQDDEDVLTERRNIHETVLHTGSPSADFCFGNGHGLPLGYTMVMYGEPKAGKSVILNSMIGIMHKEYPEAVAIKFNTEFREEAQLDNAMQSVYGIDMDRYLVFEMNSGKDIFNKIRTQLAAMAEEVQIGMVAIDSINHILGRREENQTDLGIQNIGDVAQTLKVGLKNIVRVQRRNRFGLILTAHVTAEMDPVEQMRGNKSKMSAGVGTQHYAEYFMLVSKNRAKTGRQTILEEDLLDESKKDLMGRAEATGHKIRVCMKESSLGPAGRMGEFTLDYHKGIVNTEEEIFLLGYNRGIIIREGNSKYGMAGSGVTFNGKAAMLGAIRDNPDMAVEVMKKLKEADLRGDYNAVNVNDVEVPTE